MRYRLAKSSDFAQCERLLHPGFRASVRVRRQLLRIWEAIVAGGAGCLCVIEDPAASHPQGIEGICGGVFVRDDFAQEFLANPYPYLTAVIYERILAKRSPVLSVREIAAANAGPGLHSVVLHFDFRERDYSQPRMQDVLGAAAASGYFFRAGYRLKTHMGEVYGPVARDYLLSGGFRLREDFHRHFARERQELPPEPLRPYLFLLRKEDVHPAPMNLISAFFHSPAPQLGFSISEQRVLEHALMNESDAEIAKELGISLDGVKKTWRRAFERVARANAGVIPSKGSAGRARGAEKRHHLLHYLRSHLEELRPYQRSALK